MSTPLTVEPITIAAPDAGVIEDARRRQRHHRAAGAGLLLVAAVAAVSAYLAAGAGGSATHRAEHAYRAHRWPGGGDGTHAGLPHRQCRQDANRQPEANGTWPTGRRT